MQICIALNHIHNNKIIHRDLKTQNIFLTKNGDIKIGDFGICRVLSKSDELASTSIGTPYYIAPEVCKGEPYNYKADVWSLGCIMYELCCLKRPFEGESIATILTSILNKNPDALPDTYSDLLTSTILLMLNKDHIARPTISEIIEIASAHSFSGRKSSRSRKTYQKEISINIPTPTNAPTFKNPNSAPNNIIESLSIDSSLRTNTGALTNRSNNYFNFTKSLLKQCPSSPIRPMLMGDFLKRRLGEEAFERVRRVINNSKDPVKLLREEQ